MKNMLDDYRLELFGFSGRFVSILIPYGDAGDEKGAVFVGVNGYDVLIPRNVAVDVPVEVYHVLINAMREGEIDQFADYRAPWMTADEPRFLGLQLLDDGFRSQARGHLRRLEESINLQLDRIHNESIRGFRSLARAVGQRTRIDRAKKFSLEPSECMKCTFP